ncbi:hypothetical protein ACHAPU_008315 [Fusarium lateritium]
MADNKKEPTAAEAMLFFSIVKHTRNKADVDWNAVATEAGFKNADVAKVRFGQVKRKLGISTETSAPARTPYSTPKKGTGSRVSKTTPGSAKGKGKGRKVKKEEEKDLLDDENEDDMKLSVKDENRDMEKTPEKEDLGEDDELAPDPAFSDFPFFHSAIMPPKKSSGEDGSPTGLTDGELRFIKAIFDNMTQKPDADWDAVATTLSLKDAKCAKERFRQMSVRHGWRGDSASGSPARKSASTAGDKVAKKPRAPRTPRKKATKKPEEDDEAKDETKAEDKKVKSEDEDDDDDME